MILATKLKIIGTGINALAAFALAWRVKSIIKILIEAQKAAEVNIEIIRRCINGERQEFPLMQGWDMHIQNTQENVKPLLFFGFIGMGVGSTILLLSYFV